MRNQISEKIQFSWKRALKGNPSKNVFAIIFTHKWSLITFLQLSNLCEVCKLCKTNSNELRWGREQRWRACQNRPYSLAPSRRWMESCQEAPVSCCPNCPLIYALHLKIKEIMQCYNYHVFPLLGVPCFRVHLLIIYILMIKIECIPLLFAMWQSSLLACIHSIEYVTFCSKIIIADSWQAFMKTDHFLSRFLLLFKKHVLTE